MTAEDLLREELQRQACGRRCYFCQSPATREINDFGVLYCDNHGPSPLPNGMKWRDLRGADWIRRVVALLGRPTEESKGVIRFEREEVL